MTMIVFDEFEGLDRTVPPTLDDIRKLKQRSLDLAPQMPEPLLPSKDTLNDSLEHLTC